jgi:hypothetical protein
MSLLVHFLLAAQLVANSRSGRRVCSALLVTAICAAVVGAMYDHPDRLGRAALAAAHAPATQAPASTRAAAAPAATPGAAASAWFARRSHVPAAKVRVLQEDRLAGGRVRVLVMAEVGPGRYDTALVTLGRVKGAWVPS